MTRIEPMENSYMQARTSSADEMLPLDTYRVHGLHLRIDTYRAGGIHIHYDTYGNHGIYR
jgi:hypothetical protein